MPVVFYLCLMTRLGGWRLDLWRAIRATNRKKFFYSILIIADFPGNVKGNVVNFAKN